MSLELLGFGNDITRSRLDIEENFLLLKRNDSLKDIFIFLLKKHKEDPEKTPKLSPLRKKKVRSLMALFYFEFLDYLKVLFEERPFEIHPLLIGSTEILYQAANLKNEKKLENERDVRDLLEKIERYFLINGKHFDEQLDLYFPLNNEMSFKEEEEAIENFSTSVNFELKPSDLNFDFWFAAALRQIPIQRIAEFLELHEEKFFSKEEYAEFLKNIRVEFNHLFTDTTKKTLERLLDKPEEKIQLVKVVNLKELANPHNPKQALTTQEGQLINGFSSSDFSRPDFPIEEIKLSAYPWQVRKFLSFFFLEKNGSDETFLTDTKAITYLKKYGIVVPTSPLTNRFNLNDTSDKRSIRIILTMFFKFYKKHKMNRNQKKLFVQFLKNTFTNFDNFNSKDNPNNFLKIHEVSNQNMKFNPKNYI